MRAKQSPWGKRKKRELFLENLRLKEENKKLNHISSSFRKRLFEGPSAVRINGRGYTVERICCDVDLSNPAFTGIDDIEFLLNAAIRNVRRSIRNSLTDNYLSIENLSYMDNGDVGGKIRGSVLVLKPVGIEVE